AHDGRARRVLVHVEEADEEDGEDRRAGEDAIRPTHRALVRAEDVAFVTPARALVERRRAEESFVCVHQDPSRAFARPVVTRVSTVASWRRSSAESTVSRASMSLVSASMSSN